MKFPSKTLIAAAILGLILLLAGCGRVDPPTASQPNTEEGMGLWNPKPGDHIVPGDEIPLYRPGFVEAEWGMSINPLNLPHALVHIGPEGGVIQLGRHSLTIPAGAVDADIDFRIAWASLTGIASDCLPSGLVFNVPATLTLSYVGTQFEDVADPRLNIYYAKNDGTVERYPSTVDPVNKTVSCPLNHFSRYILGGEAL
jgi:hypothetical protein